MAGLNVSLQVTRADLEFKEAIGWLWIQVPRAQTIEAEVGQGPGGAGSESPCLLLVGEQGLARGMGSVSLWELSWPRSTFWNPPACQLRRRG